MYHLIAQTGYDKALHQDLLHILPVAPWLTKDQLTRALDSLPAGTVPEDAIVLIWRAMVGHLPRPSNNVRLDGNPAFMGFLDGANSALAILQQRHVSRLFVCAYDDYRLAQAKKGAARPWLDFHQVHASAADDIVTYFLQKAAA